MKFKCSSCKHVFEAENKKQLCPKCGSERVTPYVSPIKVVLWLVSVLAVASVTFFVLRIVMTNGDGKNEIVEEYEGQYAISLGIGTESSDKVTHESTNVRVAEETAIVAEEDLEIPEPIILKSSSPTYSDGKYSIQVSSENIPENVDVVYVLMDSFGNKKIQASKDGFFKGIKFSEDGMYKVVVINETTKEVLADQIIEGFIELEKQVLVNKISKEELQRMINSQNLALMGHYKGISNKVTLNFSNLKGGEKKPKIFADIFTKITMGEWESVIITSVSYDIQNCINVVNMQVKHLDF